MTGVLVVHMYRAGLLEMLSVAFTQGPGGCSYVGLLDPKKSTEVDESLSVYKPMFCLWRILQLLYGKLTEWEIYTS